MITLILGGNKSGKSDLGLDLLIRGTKPARIIVTGKALDFEFREQINRHRRERPQWIEVQETDTSLDALLPTYAKKRGTLLVDSLDFWFYRIQGRNAEDKMQALLEALVSWSGPDLFFVSSEVGLGPLPAGRETRNFCRRLGDLHLRLARMSDRVYLTVAGYPLQVK